MRARSPYPKPAGAEHAAPARGRTRKSVVPTPITRTVVSIAGTGAILFVSAGTDRWPAARADLIEAGALVLAVGPWLAKHDAELLEERLSSPTQREQRTWDEMLVTALIMLVLGWMVPIALDTARSKRSHVPAEVQVHGDVLTPLSFHASFLTLRENSYLERARRAQPLDRTAVTEAIESHRSGMR